jgi:hypothetical protein
MKYAVEMGSGAMMYTPSLIKIGLCIQKLIGGIHRGTQTDRQRGDLISLLSFFQNKESRLINREAECARNFLSKQGHRYPLPAEQAEGFFRVPAEDFRFVG